MKKIEIYFNKRRKVLLNTEEKMINYNLNYNNCYIATILKNLEHYGFTLSVELVNILKELNPCYIVKWYKELESVIKREVGVRDNQEPMYKNFPQEVMEMSEVELYLNAIIHYATYGQVLPHSEKEERESIKIDKNKLTVLDLGTEEDFNSIFKNLLEGNAILSSSDKADIVWAISNIEFKDICPEEINKKENLVFLAELLIDNNLNEDFELLKPLFKTATDVLRLAVGLSFGDISLSERPRFKSFNAKERRLILSLLDNCKNAKEDMYRYKEYWKRLGERIHPSKYPTYKNANEAFRFIRSNEKIVTFKGKVERLFKERDLENLLELLSTRPGEFARSLDRLLRTFNSDEDTSDILDTLQDIADEIPTPLLLQLSTHFRKRTENNEFRVFFPKGDVAKSYNIENNLSEIRPNICLEITSICSFALINAYSEREELGNVYIDTELSNYIAPMNQRNAAKTLKTVGRGSKIKLDNKTNILRPFIYWKNPTSEKANSYSDCVDMDLSIATFKEDFTYHSSLGYFSYQTKENKDLYVFSGDVRNAPKGAAEYIDLNVENLLKEDIRYVVVSLNSFSQHNFKDLPDCFVGVMEREDMMSGEVFEPTTVTNKIDLSNGSTVSIPMILDLKTREIIWADMTVDIQHGRLNNILSTKNSLVYVIKSIMNIEKPNLYELFLLNTMARGTMVDNIEEADTVFTVDKYEYPTLEKISEIEKEKENIIQNLLEKEINEIDLEEVEELKELNKKIEDIKSKKIVNVTAYDLDIIVSKFI